MVSRISCSITFPGIKVRLTNPQFPGISFLPFLKVDVTFTFLRFSGTSPDHHDLSKIIESGLTMTSAIGELKAGFKEDRARFFSVIPSDRTRGNGQKLKYRMLYLNIGKHFFTVRVTEHWHRLPRKVVESPSFEIFKSHLDMVVDHQL